MKKYQIDMTEGPILFKTLLFAIPLILSGMLQLLFNAADIIVVGRFSGKEALAAVGSTSVVINLLTNLFIGLSIGSNVVFARFIGARDKKNAEETLHTSVVIAFLGGVLLAVIGVLFAGPILRGMGSPENVIGLSELYLRIYFLGMPAMMLYNFGSALLRAAGDTKRPLFFLTAAGILNIILNLVFVIVFRLNVMGVALATIISQTLSAVLLLNCLRKEEGPLRLDPKKIRLTPDKLRLILKIGLPAGLQGVVFSISNILIQSSVNSFGAVAMAGSAAAQNIENFIDIAMTAFYQSDLSFTSQNAGAGKFGRIPRILVCCLSLAVVTGIILGSAAYLNGRALIGIYNSDQEVASYGLIRMRYLCVFYFICGVMSVLVGSIRGLGYSVLPMVVTLIGSCLFRVIWILKFFPQHHTLDALFTLYPVTWVMTASAHLVCFLLIYRKIRKERTGLQRQTS